MLFSIVFKRQGLLLSCFLVLSLTVVGLTFCTMGKMQTAQAAVNAPNHTSSGAMADVSTPIKSVFVILMENHNWSDIKGSASAPYINSLLSNPQASYTNNYKNPPGIHPSEPNYLWLEAGTNYGINNDADPSTNHQSTTAHLVTQLNSAGVSWKSYQEDISGTQCPLTSTGKYAPKHDPMVFFDDVTNSNNSNSSYCIAHNRPYTELATDLTNNTVASYNFITPNLCHDMHDTCAPTNNSIAQGDNWLSTQLPSILASTAYQNGGAVFITWDEGEGGSDGPIGMIVLSPSAKGNGYSNSLAYTHSSTLRTMQEIFGVGPFLGDAANATDLSDLFASSVISTPTPSVTPTAPPITGTTFTYYLPFLANANNGYTSYLAFQNGGSSTASINLQYYTPQGNLFTTDATCPQLAARAECLPNNPFVTGNKGVGIITSNQPLAVIVAEGTPFGGSAYAVSSGGGSQLIAPLAFRNAYGDFSTQLTVFNGTATPATNVIVQFYDNSGTLQTTATQIFNLGAFSGLTLDQNLAASNLPSGFTGWAKITGASGTQLVAQVLEQSPSKKFVAIASAQTQAQSTLYAPAIFKGAFGFNTGANIVNPGSQPVTVSVTYYDSNGNPITTPPFTLAANSIQAVFQGGSGGGNGLPAGNGLTNGFSGAAIVTAQGNNGIVMVVNESGGVSASGTSLSGTYAGSAAGSGSVGLPVMANGGFGYTTGATIFNTSGNTLGGTIQYYKTDGTAVGTAQPFNIGPFASQLAYQGAAGLPSDFYGSAVVTQNGGSGSLIVTTNALSGLFYTYTEPNN